MSSFTSPLDTRRDGKDVILLRELIYYVQEEGGPAIRVPMGFRSDGASIPIPFRMLVGHPFGASLKAAVVHDWIFRAEAGRAQLEAAGPKNRRAAARIMRQAMTVDNVHLVRRWLIWLGLRVGDWLAWRKSLGTAVIDMAVVNEVDEIRRKLLWVEGQKRLGYPE